MCYTQPLLTVKLITILKAFMDTFPTIKLLIILLLITFDIYGQSIKQLEGKFEVKTITYGGPKPFENISMALQVVTIKTDSSEFDFEAEFIDILEHLDSTKNYKAIIDVYSEPSFPGINGRILQVMDNEKIVYSKSIIINKKDLDIPSNSAAHYYSALNFNRVTYNGSENPNECKESVADGLIIKTEFGTQFFQLPFVDSETLKKDATKLIYYIEVKFYGTDKTDAIDGSLAVGSVVKVADNFKVIFPK